MMWKSAVLLAVAANVVYVVSTEGASKKRPFSSSASSSHSGLPSSSSSSYDSSSSSSNGCDTKKGKKDNQCSLPNEVYDLCPATCPFRTCGIDDRLIDCIPSPTVGDPDCPPPACRCADGFFRDNRGNCVEWDACLTSQLGDPGCGCSDNYARNDEGICIPKDQCSVSCKGDPNAKPGCGVNCGRLCSNYQNDDVSCIQVCYDDGCDCKENYVLDTNIGKCVLPDQCTPTCKANEVYSNCTQSICRAQDCSQKGQPIACASVAEGYCNKGCVCAEGFLRDSNGNCVPEDQCDAPTCKANEVFSNCTQAICRPQDCSEKGQQISCAAVVEGNCNKGCVCAKGFLRDSNGNCVAEDECKVPESCGGDPNAKPGCGVNCGRLCSNYKNSDQIACPAICNLNGCDCKEGYVLDGNIGKCVLPDQCTPTCKANEVFSNCTQAICRPQDCSEKGQQISCAAVVEGNCNKGCVCAKGFLRDSNGNCVAEDECKVPESCGGDPNAKPGCGVNCGRLCSNYKNSDQIACPAICYLDGCDCKEGYVLDGNIGKCVLPDQCTPTCKANEVFSNCTQAICRPQDCSEKGQQISCAAVVEGNCNKGCVCAKGFLRDSNGNCVAEDECKVPESCGGDPNAKPGCGVNCGRLCSNYKNSDQIACTAICNLNGCDCKEGYVLDGNIGKCVLPDQCTPTCKANEVFSNCTQAICRPQDCSEKGQQISCAAVVEGNCNKGCVCAKGFLRDSNGNCVAEDECKVPESCGGDPNAKPGCGVNCGRLCSNYKNSDQIVCPAICKLDGCDCKEGYVLDGNIGKCVLPEQCSNQNQCNKPNEEYQKCPDCSPGTCESIGKRYNCPLQLADSSNCKGECRCKSGYYRNKIGECITEAQCLQCNGTNEYFSCGPECDNVCATLDQQSKDNCPIINIQCNKKCYCEDGYARDENNICVPIDQCTENQNQCTKPNEEYQKCPDCSPGTCESIGKRYNCPLQLADSSNCKGECRCKSGYFRNKIGECITKEQCLQCNGTNEYFSCGPECDNVCATLDQQSKDNCPIINIQCNKKCYCEDGYARDENNICVPIDQCTGACKENERYVECPDAECGPKTCADAGFPVSCPRIASGRCPSKPACICNSGYLRNSEGICVPQNECPACGGDPNARPGCGVNCGRLCSNYQSSGGVACPAICNLNGCDCKEGFVLDTNTGKCVQPEQCTSPCGQNEVYSNCVNGSCDKRNCTQVNDPKICIHPRECVGGCVCQDGYLRDSKGVCIPENECEEKCPDGETFSDCPPVYSKKCNSELCPRSRDDPAVCATTRQCGEPRCVCAYLRKRNRETGKCVLASDCPPFPCDGQNEIYDSCPAGCPGENCSDYINNSTCSSRFRIGIVVPCKPACRCQKNTYRNAEGICVSTNECERSNDRTTKTATDDTDDNQQSDLEQGNTAFTCNFLYEVLTSKPGENLIISPFSVLIPLAELALYSNGPSLTQLLKVFNLQNKDQVRSTFPNLINNLDSEQNNTLDLGARVYVNQNYQLTQDFEDDTALFNAKADTINVNNPDSAAAEINDWVSDITRGKITDLVSADMITALTRLVLANAIYFKGTWKTQFDPKNTKDQDFYINRDDTKQVKMMNLKDKFNYAEISDIDAKVLQLPYVGGDMSLIAILPNQIDGLVSLVEKLRDETVFNNAINGLSLETVTVSFPKMDISTTVDLKKILQQLNVTGIFDQSGSGLQGIITKDEYLYVSAAVEKATFTADEEGSEAAAANAVVVGTRSLPLPPPQEYIFNADHPFVFAILYKQLILFIGTFAK